MSHRPHNHQYLTLALEFINWGLFFAVWIALAVNIGRDDQFCRDVDGSHSHTKECDTIYTAFAFAIADWILFTVTFFFVAKAVMKKDGSVGNEKVTGNTTATDTNRPSDVTAV